MMRDVAEWLEGLGLGTYAEVFAENDVDLDVLPHLSEEHLKELGVSLGDRVRLLKAIEALEAASADVSESPPTPDPGAGAMVPSGEAERRQLTVMFCDLVSSTALSTKLDPEDLREVIRAYQDTCAKVIARYGGYTAKYMGDGVLVYFGYPQAHENDAERAARTGLGLVEAVAEIGAAYAPVRDLDLAVRVGIDTGLVVVGDIVGEDAAEEASVIGETPNVAARLQALARPNQVVIGSLTRALIGEAFACEDLGEHPLKGVAQPVRAWNVMREGASDSPDEAKRVGGGLPLVGRQEELGLLVRSWEVSKDGHGQAVLIQGEAGIGKSRLIEALRDHISGEGHTWVATRCSPYHANSTLYPVIEHMKRVMAWKPEDAAEVRLRKLEAGLTNQSLPAEEAVPLYAELMSLPLPEGRYAPLDLGAEQKREKTLDALSGWLLEEAERSPVLQVWEDLHWADPTTLELLGHYIEQSPTVSMLNVLTYRPGFVPPWTMRSHMTPITINRLERAEVEALIGHQAAGKSVPSEVVQHIVDKSDGVPLFVEELTKTILESDYLREEADRYTLAGSLSEVAIPASLQDSLMARLDRLPTLREVAQMGAVLGREFAYEMLRAVAGIEEPQLQNGLELLVADELLYQRGRLPRSKYIFKHALIQDAAYQSLLKRTRQRCHQRVAELFEERFQDTVEANPELVAHHYTEAGNAERAVHYWRRAGERAAALSSGLEACNHFERSITLLETLPPGEDRDAMELILRLGHAWALQLTRGPADAELGDAYARALELSQTVAEPAQRVAAMFGVWRHNFWRSGARAAVPYSDGLWSIGERSESVSDRVLANYVRATTRLMLGDEETGATNAKIAWELFKDSAEDSLTYRLGHNQGVSSLLILAWSQWALGRPTAARATIEEALVRAQAMSEPLTLTIVRVVAAAVFELLGEERRDNLDAARALASEYGFTAWAGLADTCLGWLEYRAGRAEEGLRLMEGGIETWRAAGFNGFTTDRLALYGRMCLEAGQLDRARRILTESELLAEETGEKFWLTEIQRYLGALALAENGDREAAEGYFRRALGTAEARGAFGFALRAAIDLARYLDDGGQRAEANQILSGIYARFDADDDTSDLRAAKALLNQLA